ncbi:hypothetical protein C8N46_105310 [Kordia periserrulae]|uniref:Uncharacterized protein n=1 Tax=Kordia periserrulae TaxID=701523 RepID=A0A2T6BYL5_9FLAO|nr:hypothetical protein [Kordia periserrulae]PTX61153.1 hypothetical protein C8N46_105310 [Kordia periserrulae]
MSHIYRGFVLLVAILCAVGCAYFGSIYATGGAIGMGLLSGMCFISIAISFIGTEE